MRSCSAVVVNVTLSCYIIRHQQTQRISLLPYKVFKNSVQFLGDTALSCLSLNFTVIFSFFFFFFVQINMCHFIRKRWWNSLSIDHSISCNVPHVHSPLKLLKYVLKAKPRFRLTNGAMIKEPWYFSHSFGTMVCFIKRVWEVIENIVQQKKVGRDIKRKQLQKKKSKRV